MGFTEFYWVFLGFTGFYRVIIGFTGFYRVLLGFPGFNRVLLGFMGFYGFYWVFSIRPHFIDIRSTETARVPPPNLEDALQDASDARDARDARMPRASTTPAPRFSNNPSHSKSCKAPPRAESWPMERFSARC